MQNGKHSLDVPHSPSSICTATMLDELTEEVEESYEGSVEAPIDEESGG